MVRRKRIMESGVFSLATGSGSISYSLRRSARRRTIEIAIAESAQVCVTAPRFTAAQEIEDFIHAKAGWITKKLRETAARQAAVRTRRYEDGHWFFFLGKEYPLRVQQGGRRGGEILFDGMQWAVKLPAALHGDGHSPVVKELLIRWYRQQAGEIFGGRVFHFARRMGQEPRKIAVKTQKRIWGSCAHHSRSINLNWHLVLAPLEVIDYVVVHELCHLEVPNHSRRFWKRVHGILPDYRRWVQWLKDHAVEMKLP